VQANHQVSLLKAAGVTLADLSTSQTLAHWSSNHQYVNLHLLKKREAKKDKYCMELTPGCMKLICGVLPLVCVCRASANSWRHPTCMSHIKHFGFPMDAHKQACPFFYLRVSSVFSISQGIQDIDNGQSERNLIYHGHVWCHGIMNQQPSFAQLPLHEGPRDFFWLKTDLDADDGQGCGDARRARNLSKGGEQSIIGGATEVHWEESCQPVWLHIHPKWHSWAAKDSFLAF